MNVRKSYPGTLLLVLSLLCGVNAEAGENRTLTVPASGEQTLPQSEIRTSATPRKDRLFYEFSGRFGSLIERSLDLSEGARWGDTFSYSVHLGIGIQTRGDSYWEEFFGYPRYGIRVAYTAYSGSVFGDYISLYPFIQGPFFRTNRFSVEYGLGFGISCHTKKSDPVTNPQNYDIHTRFTGYIDLSLLAAYQISSHFDIFGGVNFAHNSNARTRRPNRGTNAPSVEFGLRYHPAPRLMSKWRRDIPKPTYLKNEFYTSIAPFFNANNKNDKQTYHFCATWEVGYFRRLNPCLLAGAALDLFYVDGYNSRPYVGGSNWNNLTLGLCGSFEMLFGRVSFRMAVGYVAMNRGVRSVGVYERFGAYYNFGRRTRQFAGITIKALGAKADYMELTYGVKLWRF